MEYSSDLEQAMQVVRKYDPDTFARMQAARWYALSDPFAALDKLSASLWVASDTLRQYRQSMAITINPANGDPDAMPTGDLDAPMVLVNHEQVNDAARGSDVEAVWMLATVLVHEYPAH